MSHPIGPLTIICVAVLGALVFALGANVTRLRSVGSSEDQGSMDPENRLFIAVRAHGNAAEYIPTLMVLMLLSSALSGGWWPSALAVAAVVVRVVHAAGMLTSQTLAKPTLAREVGAAGTYLVGLALAVTAIATR